jgi:Fe-S cluster assembly protein SufD
MDREGRRVSKAGEKLVAHWSEASADLGTRAGDVAFVRELRERARASLVEQGLPHTGLEDWRHTSLAPLELIDWTIAGASASAPDRLPDLALEPDMATRVALVDGRLIAALSTSAEAGSRILPIARVRAGGDDDSLLGEVLGQLADPKTDAFTALNTSLLDDGVLIEIGRHSQIEHPMHVVVAAATSQRLQCPRLAVIARAGSRSVLVVEHVTLGEGPRLTSLVSELILEADARLDVVFLQREHDQSLLVSNVHARQARDSRLSIHTLSIGGRLIRNTLGAVLADPGCVTDMRGLFVGAGARHIDNHTVADHAMPHTTSRELYKGVLGGDSRGVFCGRVIVRPDAQKSDSTQSNPNLLLTPRAEIDTQPQLEIYADDVKCSHGATIGRLDADALFFLRSRGIGLDDARVMLTRGFANEILDALPGERLRERVGAWVEAALEEAIPEAHGSPR